MSTPIDISALVPGGIQPADRVHAGTNDGTCSRCRQVPDNVPLMLWDASGDRMWIYCEACRNAGSPALASERVPGEAGTSETHSPSTRPAGQQ